MIDQITQLSIVMPCLNEERTLEICINKAKKFLEINSIIGEIIIADNGSTDNSIKIAKKCEIKIVNVKEKGYGSALFHGIKASKSQYIIMGDADDSYDFEELNLFYEKLKEGNDLVIGNRFLGGIEKGAMPFLHKYLGNPVLSFIGRLFFNSNVRDFHCGLRGINFNSFLLMNLKTSGMEFASEMIVKAHLLNMKITEVPTKLYKDGRDRKPHLNTWSDGWRHLRFLLLYSPKWLFWYPGLFLTFFGIILSFILIIKPIRIQNVILESQSLLFSSALVIIGYQILIFYGLTKVYTVNQKMLPKSNRYDDFFKIINLEKGIFLGIFFVLIGLGGTFYGISIWSENNYNYLNIIETIKIFIPSVTFIILGIQTILFSFFFSILGLEKIEN